MKQLIRGAEIYTGSGFNKKDILLDNGIIAEISAGISPDCAEVVYNFQNSYVFPGFKDVHVHLREPGFSYKETVKTGTLAAAASGYTALCAMPNLNPVPDSLQNIAVEEDIIDRDAAVSVYPYASITKGEKGEELSDMDSLADRCIAFSDDGKGVQNGEIMKEAMTKAKSLSKIIAAHCEDNSLLFGGYINDCEYARAHSHKGISSASEYKQIERDINLAAVTGCSYHVCHISTKESVTLIREAKKSGIDITCETAPHYLTLSDSDLMEDARFKMNPPLRGLKDKEALLCGLADGTIDMIATDHAPHSKEEKSRGLKESPMGITGLETAFPVLYTRLVKTEILTLEKLIELMSVNPGRRFKIPGEIAVGKTANLTVFDLSEKFTVDSNKFISMGKCTPFDGWEVFGKCKLTVCNGKTVWQEGIK